MVRWPPSGSASRALTTRFAMTCSIWPGSAFTRPSPEPARKTSSISSPINRWSMVVMPDTTVLRSRTLGASICFRLKASSCFVSAAARSAVFFMSSMSRRRGWSAGSRLKRMAPRPKMTVSRLLKSWATPPAKRPTASSRWSCRTCVSAACSASWARCCSMNCPRRLLTSSMTASRSSSDGRHAACATDRESQRGPQTELSRRGRPSGVQVRKGVRHPHRFDGRPHAARHVSPRREDQVLTDRLERTDLQPRGVPIASPAQHVRLDIDGPQFGDIPACAHPDRLQERRYPLVERRRLRQHASHRDLHGLAALGPLAVRQVAHEPAEEHRGPQLRRRNRQLHWELSGVPVERHDLDPLVQDRAYPGRQKVLDAAPVLLAITLRYDRVPKAAPEHLRQRPSEHPLGLGIPAGDAPVGVHGDDGFERRLDDQANALLVVAHGPRGRFRLDPDLLLAGEELRIGDGNGGMVGQELHQLLLLLGERG